LHQSRWRKATGSGDQTKGHGLVALGQQFMQDKGKDFGVRDDLVACHDLNMNVSSRIESILQMIVP
jgi:hypothetical protein